MGKINIKDLIVYENENYFIINKPSFISTLDDRNDDISILRLAKSYAEDAQVCHRLDKETSGTLAIAKNNEAYRNLALQFENREVIKVYHAVVDGIHNFKDLLIDAPILPLPKGAVKIDYREGKWAETIVYTLKTFKSHTLVSCFPITGRMHQIRIHLSSVKAPIVGDEQYGGLPFYLSSVKKKFNLKRFTEEEPLIKRVALHAQGLKFKDIDGKEIDVTSPYPKDFAVLLKQLDKNV